MRDNFRPNVRITTNILMVIGTFLVAFNISKMSTESKEEQRIFDCARLHAGAMFLKDFNKKYELFYSEKRSIESNQSAVTFCKYYGR